MTSNSFQLTRVRGAPVTEAELISDLKRVGEITGTGTVSQPQYTEYGIFDMKNLSRRFGGWNKALAAAGLGASVYLGEYSEEELFANILVLWQHLGRQPRRSELESKTSKISQSPYNRKFGSWTAALEKFVAWANAVDSTSVTAQTGNDTKRTTPRDPSLRLRFKVLQRDRFACCGCGASPAIKPGTILHIDHIVAWSKGGETTSENLRTLCLNCNLGKGNVL